MRNDLFFPILAVVAAAMVALALVWPQGLGDRSPGPFGSTPIQRSPEMQAAMKRQTEDSEQRMNQARAVVADRQTQAISPTK